MSRIESIASCFALAAVLAAGSAQALQRVFVASTGSDASPCTPTSPCRSFAHALTVVDPGGEIVALDAAGYGAVTIDKSVTITANPGVYAGIAVSSDNAVTIATPGVDVVLRGLNINATTAVLLDGVQMSAGHSLSIENCVISNFAADGVAVFGGSAIVRIVNSLFRGNADGITLFDDVTATVSGTTIEGSSDVAIGSSVQMAGSTGRLSLSDSTLSGNATGVAAVALSGRTSLVSVMRTSISGSSTAAADSLGPGATLSIGYSQLSQNAVGFRASDGAILTLGNNLVAGNGSDTQTNGSGAVTALPGL